MATSIWKLMSFPVTEAYMPSVSVDPACSNCTPFSAPKSMSPADACRLAATMHLL